MVIIFFPRHKIYYIMFYGGGRYMKKRLFVTFSLKALLFPLIICVLCAAFVLSLDLFYLKTQAVASPNSSSINMPTIIVDAGHGGEDGGTSSSSGILEKDINLAISKKLENLFSLAGIKVIMTREDDSLIYDSGLTKMRQKKVSDIHNRMRVIEENPNSIFLSIHQNYFQESKYNGAQVFYSKNSSQSSLIAEMIQNEIKAQLQPDNERKIKPSGSEIYLLYHAQSPSVMVECGFMSNPGEAQKLNDDSYQTKMAFAIYNAIISYLNGM